jgi:hypothetical protein
MIGIGNTELLVLGFICMGMIVIPGIIAAIVFRIVGGSRREHGGGKDES